MIRSLCLVALAVLMTTFAVSWRASGADDGQNVQRPGRGEQSPQVEELLERIISLEKRIAALEHAEVLIRQVDSRSSGDTIVPATKQPANKGFDEPADHGDEDAILHTNGHRWRVRLLGHRSSKANL